MKTLFIFLTLVASVGAYATNGLKPAYLDGAFSPAGNNAEFVADFNATTGNCWINGFEIKSGDAANSTNTRELGWSLCVPAGDFNKTNVTQISSGSYPGAYKGASDIDPATCRIDSSGVDRYAATCGGVNP